MPVVDVALWDLERLTGAVEGEILKALEHVKGEIEGREGDRIRLEVAHDRPDHFSAEGLARTVKGVLGAEKGAPKADVRKSSLELIYDGVIEERPYALMAVVRDLRLDDEAIIQMIQLQEKLHDSYGRDRRKIAIGFYDLGKIKPPIYYKRVSAEDEYIPLGAGAPMKIREMFEATDKGRKYAGLIRRDAPPALVDSEGKIMVVIPVLGSECCKVTSSTRDVLIDITGHDLSYIIKILSILIYNLIERSISKIVEIVKINNQYIYNLSGKSLVVRRSDVEELLGVELGREEYEDLLGRSRYDVGGENVVVPPYRINVISWVDIAEDIAIMKGYNKFPREPPPMSAAGRRHRVELLTEDARRIMTSLGFHEVANYILAPSQLLQIFGLRYAELLNPVSERLNAVRSSIIPELVELAPLSKKGEVKIFEVGEVFDGGTKRAVAFLVSKDALTVTDGLSYLRALCIRLGLRCDVEEHEAPWCTAGRCAKIKGDVEGVVGEVRPEILEKLGAVRPIVVAELLF
ncbi:MAG: phenylalanine--tRNA ligase subunit beta [Thermoproteus sp.]|nr:phenylalanine--tRNA ligase subunit beta [Thermoproteus sp.]